MKYNGIVLADIHIGNISEEKLYDELKHTLLDYIKKIKKLDFVIICGDYFDKKFYLNDSNSLFAYTFMAELLEICKKKNNEVKIRIVYGTESHECNQYNILSKLNQYFDFKVIRHVSSEELLPGMNVLYVPEEYMNNKEEFYKEYFNGDQIYNYIFGHGVIREVMKEVATMMETSTSKRKHVPVFSTAELNQVCVGQTYFGHYHVNTNINDKVFYVGSFSRWQFGEEDKKGFYHISYDSSKDKYSNEFIENTCTDIYKTIRFGYENNIFSSMDVMEDRLNHIDKMINDEMFNHVRFEFNIPDNCENPEAIVNYLKERYKFNTSIKLNIVHGYIEQKKKKDNEKIENENEKYSIIFDDSVPIEDKVSYFIGIEYNKQIPIERVSDYLFKPLNELMSDIEE